MKRFSAPSAATGAKRPNTGFKVPFKVPFKSSSADAMVADSGAQPAASAAPKPIPPRAPGLAGASNGETFKKGFRPPDRHARAFADEGGFAPPGTELHR